MNLDLPNLFSRAWQITWKYKVLWIFGFLASLASGSSSNFNFNFNSGRSINPNNPSTPLPPEWERQFEQFFGRGDQATPMIIGVVIGILCLVLLLTLVFMALSVIGRGGLIGGSRLANVNGSLTFGEAWGEGTRKFWTLFGISLLIALPVLLFVLILILPGAFLAVATAGLGVLCLIPLICLLIPVAIVLGVLSILAQIAAYVEDLGAMAAIRRAWAVLRANAINVIVLALVMGVLAGIISFVLNIPIFFIVIPAAIAVVAGAANENQTLIGGGLVFALVCCVAYLPVLIVVGSALQTWVTTTWTLAYEQMAGKAASTAPVSPYAPVSPTIS